MAGERAALLVHTGRIDFASAWAAQKRIAERRRAGEVPDVVWLLEHDPVYTTGRHGSRTDLHVDDATLARLGATFHIIDRGGQMTWHGPGQTTGYVIADLRPGRRVRSFVEALVEAMRQASGVPEAVGHRDALGLYRDGRKLGSVGVRVSGGVTMHGLALNRDADLDWFARITACAAPGVEATSIALEGGRPDRERVESELADALADGLGLSLELASLDDALGRTTPSTPPGGVLAPRTTS